MLNGDRYSTPPTPESLHASTTRLERALDKLERGRPLAKSKRVPVIYVAGPFTAPTPEGIRDNIRRAALLGHEVRKLGCYVLVPHLIGAPYVFAASAAELPDDFGYRWWIEETLEHMRRCDAVIMTSDWATSNGARGERDDARGRGQPVFLSLAQLKDWMGRL